MTAELFRNSPLIFFDFLLKSQELWEIQDFFKAGEAKSKVVIFYIFYI